MKTQYGRRKGFIDLNAMLTTPAFSGAGASPYLPIITTGANFDAAGMRRNISSPFNEITNINRITLASSSITVDPGGGMWAGWIKATDCTMVLNNSSPASNPLQVSINGGAFSNAPLISGTTYTVFTGLANVEHFVVLKTGTPYGITGIWVDKLAPTIFSLSGTDSYIRFIDRWIYSGVASTFGKYESATRASTATNYVPAVSRNGVVSSTSNVGVAKIRGAFQNIVVTALGSGARFYYLSIDGAAPTRYEATNNGTGGTGFRISGLDGFVHDYYVWSSGIPTAMSLAVAGDSTMLTTSANSIHQYGDSITNGTNQPDLYGEVELLAIGASLGYCGLTLGVSGQTTVQLDTAMASYTPAVTVTSNDVAIIAIGRNDVASWTATQVTAYTNIINALLTKGYGKVLCRAVLPNGDGTVLTGRTTVNTSIQSIVTGLANPNVIFIGTDDCPLYTTYLNDNTHPNAAGYAVLRTYLQPKYDAVI